MPSYESRIVLVDDLRSFVDGRSADVVRTSTAGAELLERCRDQRLDELWLDHDLGEGDTIWPFVEVLERAAFDGRPFDVGVINIHSANPTGAAKMAQALRRWGYRVNIASNSPDVAYLDNPTRRNDQRPTPVQEVS
ncbi:cyclic-phosphate processing receiver domain-containing protein [Salinispora mooreana]|uniref:cyclic-phosphate processing receiver domain-containing protein n=1 Tax=Salinispora mooreana TaxID=999545 RepID=UPI00037D79E2|nr:cyclic-phosphate processing receiver domain-containing protein [Salinispora mooreana]